MKEWEKLGHTVREQAKKKLRQRLVTPRVPADALRELPDHYKIKLKASGHRLVYRVEDDRVVVLVLAVGKRAARPIGQLPNGDGATAVAHRRAVCKQL